jgi:hypothetical protein
MRSKRTLAIVALFAAGLAVLYRRRGRFESLALDLEEPREVDAEDWSDRCRDEGARTATDPEL